MSNSQNGPLKGIIAVDEGSDCYPPSPSRAKQLLLDCIKNGENDTTTTSSSEATSEKRDSSTMGIENAFLQQLSSEQLNAVFSHLTTPLDRFGPEACGQQLVETSFHLLFSSSHCSPGFYIDKKGTCSQIDVCISEKSRVRDIRKCFLCRYTIPMTDFRSIELSTTSSGPFSWELLSLESDESSCVGADSKLLPLPKCDTRSAILYFRCRFIPDGLHGSPVYFCGDDCANTFSEMFKKFYIETKHGTVQSCSSSSSESSASSPLSPSKVSSSSSKQQPSSSPASTSGLILAPEMLLREREFDEFPFVALIGWLRFGGNPVFHSHNDINQFSSFFHRTRNGTATD